MSRRARAWQFFVSASLSFACNDTKTNTSDIIEGTECSKNTKCPSGYKCDFGSAAPSDPASLGQCKYEACGLTDPCKKPQKACGLPEETAMCDRFNNDAYCECTRPNAQEVPSTPTTGGIPTTGGKP